MGIGSELRRQFIARPDDSKDQILYKWPDTNIRMFTQLTVQQDEQAVFFKDGAVQGTLATGRHNLDGKDIPFIGAIIDAATGGNLLISELYFVSTREFTNLPFGGKLDTLEDPDTSMIVDTRVFGDYSIIITNPQDLILKLVGTQQLSVNESVTDWVKSQLLKTTRELIAEKVSSKAWDLIGIAQYQTELETELLPKANKQLETYGIKIKQFGNITVNLKDEDADMLKKFRRDQAYSQTPNAADAALKVGIGRGMESGNNAAGDTGVGLGVGIAVGSDLLKDKDKKTD